MNNRYPRILRPSLRGLLLLPVMFAALFMATARFNPWRSQPDWHPSDWLVRWSESGYDFFLDQEIPTDLCFLKLGCYDGRDRYARYHFRRWSVSPYGDSKIESGSLTKFTGVMMSLTAEDFSEMRKIIQAMPPSNDSIPPGNVMVAGFRVGGTWTARRYNQAALPPPVGRLFDILDNSRMNNP